VLWYPHFSSTSKHSYDIALQLLEKVNQFFLNLVKSWFTLLIKLLFFLVLGDFVEIIGFNLGFVVAVFLESTSEW